MHRLGRDCAHNFALLEPLENVAQIKVIANPYTLGCFMTYGQKMKVVKQLMHVDFFVPFGLRNESVKF